MASNHYQPPRDAFIAPMTEWPPAIERPRPRSWAAEEQGTDRMVLATILAGPVLVAAIYVLAASGLLGLFVTIAIVAAALAGMIELVRRRCTSRKRSAQTAGDFVFWWIVVLQILSVAWGLMLPACM
jgi:hypothetical protein